MGGQFVGLSSLTTSAPKGAVVRPGRMSKAHERKRLRINDVRRPIVNDVGAGVGPSSGITRSRKVQPHSERSQIRHDAYEEGIRRDRPVVHISLLRTAVERGVTFFDTAGVSSIR